MDDKKLEELLEQFVEHTERIAERLWWIALWLFLIANAVCWSNHAKVGG